MVDKKESGPRPQEGGAQGGAPDKGVIVTPNPLEVFWEKYQKHICTLVIVGVAIYFIFYVLNIYQEKERNRDALRNYDESGLLKSYPDFDSAVSLAEKADAAELDGLIEHRKGTRLEPMLRVIRARRLLEKGDEKAALEEIDRLKSAYPQYPWLKKPITYAFHDNPVGVVEGMVANIEANRRAREKYPFLFANPEPEKAFAAVMETDKGTITLRFYPKQAPNQVKTFCTNVLKGFYDGIKVQGVTRDDEYAGHFFDFGNPLTKDPKVKPEQWATKGGWDDPIPYAKNSLYHFKGAVAFYRKAKTEKNTSSQLVRIMGADRHEFDGEHNVFAQVVEGMDVVQKILTETEFKDDNAKQGLPTNPPVIKKITLTGDWAMLGLPKIERSEPKKEAAPAKPNPPVEKDAPTKAPEKPAQEQPKPAPKKAPK